MAQRDLTTGSIPRGILGLAVPMIGSSILHSIQSLVDMFFVGKLGSGALAAVGMSGTAIMLLITVFIGINISTAAMVSRAIGAGNDARASHVASQSLLLTLIFSVLVGVAGYAGSPYILKALGAEKAVIEQGTGYLHIVFLGIFFLCAAFVISGIFHGVGDAVTPLILGVVATVCNIILNPLFIFGYWGFPAMGVRGSAVATVIARVIAFAVGIIILLRGRRRVRLSLRDSSPNFRTMWTILAIGIPASLQMSVRTLMMLALMTIVAKFGTLIVAAYTVGLRIRMIGLFPLFGFAGSGAIMVGQNLGARRSDRSQRGAYIATGMAFAAASFAALIFFVFAPELIAVFNHAKTVIAAGSSFLRVTAVGLLTASIAIVLGRAMNGAGDTVSPLIITLVSLWGFQIPAAVYLSGVREMWGFRIPWTHVFDSVATNSETGIWYAMVAASVLQAVLTAAWFSTGRWKHKKL